MSFPAGQGGLNTDGFAATAGNGSLPGLANNTQANVTSVLKNRLQGSPSWSQLGRGMGQALQTTQNSAAGAVAGAITGASGSGVDPSAHLRDWSSQNSQQAQTAASNITNISTGISGTSDTTQVAPTVTGIQAATTANSNAIAALQTTQQGSTTGGAATSTTFSTPSTGTIGPGFLLDSFSYGTWEVVAGSGAGVQHNSGEGAYVKWALSTTPMQTDNHQVTLVVGNAPNSVTGSAVIIRAAADMSSFVYCSAISSQVAIGYGTLSGGTLTLNTPWATESASIAQGQSITVTANGPTYTATSNGAVLVSHTDTAPQSPVGPANRSIGFFTSTGSSWGTWYSSWFIASINASDVTPPAVVGTGWNIYCTNTTTGGVALAGSVGWTGVGATTYDTEGPTTSNIDIVSLGFGVIQVPVTGWYHVNSTGVLYNSPGTGGSCAAGLYVRPASSGTLGLARVGADHSGTTYTVEISDLLYLNAGDQVSPAFRAGSNALLGAVNGSETRFSGVLVSKA